MKQPINSKQNFSSDKTKIILVIIFLAILLLVFGILLGLVLRRSGFQLLLPAAQRQASPTSSPASIASTLFIPTADCGVPTLVLGTSTFQIQNLSPAPDGSFAVPSDTSGIAYWVEGINTNPVFVLSPTPQNLTVMSTISIGTSAKVTRSNCNSSTYKLSAGQTGLLDISAFSDQAIENMIVFFQTDNSGAGFVFKGELTEEQISTINTPETGGSDIHADIGLLDTTTSADGTTIRIGVSIYNWGQSAFALSVGDVLLTQQDSTALQ